MTYKQNPVFEYISGTSKIKIVLCKRKKACRFCISVFHTVLYILILLLNCFVLSSIYRDKLYRLRSKKGNRVH